MEDFVENCEIDLFYCSRIAAPCIVYEPINAAIVPVHNAYGFSHMVELRHASSDGQAAWKLLREFLQRFGAACEKGDFRATIRQGDRRRQPDPRRSACDNENMILYLHRSIIPL